MKNKTLLFIITIIFLVVVIPVLFMVCGSMIFPFLFSKPMLLLVIVVSLLIFIINKALLYLNKNNNAETVNNVNEYGRQGMKVPKGLVWFIGIMIFIFLVSNWYGMPDRNYVNDSVEEIKQQVANDEEQQYYMAKRHGNQMEIYTHASLVAEGYLQAHDEANYIKWKAITNEEGRKAGVPSSYR